MELQRVVTIVESLAAGVDPETGTNIPNAVFHTPDVIRALVAAAALLRERGDTPSATTPNRNRPAAAGQRWSDEEDSLLCHSFDGGTAIADLARQHGRSAAAITLRLVKLGRIDPATVKVRERGARVA